MSMTRSVKQYQQLPVIGSTPTVSSSYVQGNLFRGLAPCGRANLFSGRPLAEGEVGGQEDEGQMVLAAKKTRAKWP